MSWGKIVLPQRLPAGNGHALPANRERSRYLVISDRHKKLLLCLIFVHYVLLQNSLNR